MDDWLMDVKKDAIRKKIESGKLDDISNKELKIIISDILSEDLTIQSLTRKEPR
jgi:hypothetical protein